MKRIIRKIAVPKTSWEAAENESIEATNNRNAVKALRQAIRKGLLVGGHDLCSKGTCDFEDAKRLLAETTPKKLAGGK